MRLCHSSDVKSQREQSTMRERNESAKTNKKHLRADLSRQATKNPQTMRKSEDHTLEFLSLLILISVILLSLIVPSCVQFHCGVPSSLVDLFDGVFFA